MLTEKDKEFAGHIVRNLESANQEVPKDLMDLALKSSWFKSSRFKRGGGGDGGGGYDRSGLGFGSGGGSQKASTSAMPEYLTSSAPSGPRMELGHRYGHCQVQKRVDKFWGKHRRKFCL